MPSPFPSMDPYVEERYDWSTVHLPLIVTLARYLRRGIPQGFVAKVWQEDELQQRHLCIYDRRHGGREVVTNVELLSPTNKDGAEGSAQYKRKQREARESGINLLEIDLLRYGTHVAYVPKAVLDESGPYDYLITLADADCPLQYRFWRIGLRDTLPALALPLTPDVAPIPLDLQAVFETCYDESGLGDTVDYTREPEPPLSPENAVWADGLLRTAGLRP